MNFNFKHHNIFNVKPIISCKWSWYLPWYHFQAVLFRTFGVLIGSEYACAGRSEHSDQHDWHFISSCSTLINSDYSPSPSAALSALNQAPDEGSQALTSTSEGWETHSDLQTKLSHNLLENKTFQYNNFTIPILLGTCH